MKNLNIQQQVPKQIVIAFGLAVGGLLVGLIGYLIVVSPAKSRLSTVNKELDIARNSLITAENTPAPTKQPPIHASDIFQMTKAMPNTDDLPGVLISLSNLAARSAVQLKSVTPGTDTTGTGYTMIPMTVAVHGTYPSITRFLRNVRNSVVVTDQSLIVRGRLFVAGGVSLTTPDGKSVDATVTMDAFAYTPAPPATPAAPTDPTATTTTATG